MGKLGRAVLLGRVVAPPIRDWGVAGMNLGGLAVVRAVLTYGDSVRRLPLQINHPLQQVLVRVAGVEADGGASDARAASGPGAGDYLDAGVR